MTLRPRRFDLSPHASEAVHSSAACVMDAIDVPWTKKMLTIFVLVVGQLEADAWSPADGAASGEWQAVYVDDARAALDYLASGGRSPTVIVLAEARPGQFGARRRGVVASCAAARRCGGWWEAGAKPNCAVIRRQLAACEVWPSSGRALGARDCTRTLGACACLGIAGDDDHRRTRRLSRPSIR